MGDRVVGTVSTIIDMTEHAAAATAMRQQAAAEEALRQQAAAEEALRQQEAYLSLAAHELRTPLTTLLGRAQLVQRWLSASEVADDRALRSVGIVVEQAQRLNAMITSVVELSRAQLGRLDLDPQALDVAGMARRAVVEQSAAAPSHQIILEVASEPLPARADRARLDQVLRSLIGNAVKFSPGGGSILVRALRHGGEVWLSVADEGIGIPAGDLAQLFEPHFRARNAERLGIKGLGIELFLASRIVELHGGGIGVESAEGRGSTFTVRLPLAEP
jgi:signal transduction histidine kinase